MPRILLIDDDAQLGPPLAAYFARFDFRLDCALKPSLGLAQLKRERYDAAILDVMLPDLDGFEVCRRVKQNPATRLIPVVLVTALQARALTTAQAARELGIKRARPERVFVRLARRREQQRGSFAACLALAEHTQHCSG